MGRIDKAGASVRHSELTVHRTSRRAGLYAGLLCALGTLTAAGIPTGMAHAQTAVAGEVQYTTSGSMMLPRTFANAIVASGNASPEPATVDGKSQTVYTALLSWPGTELGDAGTFIVNKPGSYIRVSGKGDADWDAFVPKLIGMGKVTDGWSVVTVRFVAPEGGVASLVTPANVTATAAAAAPPATVTATTPAIPQTQLPGESVQGLSLRQDIARSLTGLTPGTNFPGENVLVPSDLGAVRNAMLRYGNIERKALDRTAIAKARAMPAVGASFQLGNPAGGQTFKVTVQGDLTLNDRLNQAAQWFAEARAAGKGDDTGHGFTGTFNDNGKTVVMKTFGDRIAYFGGPAGDGEIGGTGGPGDFPYGWMGSNTHLAWYFGIGGPYKEVGYGAALAPNGTWYYVGLGALEFRAFPDGHRANQCNAKQNASDQDAVLDAINCARRLAPGKLSPLTWSNMLATQAQASADGRNPDDDANTDPAVAGATEFVGVAHDKPRASDPGGVLYYQLVQEQKPSYAAALGTSVSEVGCGWAERSITASWLPAPGPWHRRVVVCRFNN